MTLKNCIILITALLICTSSLAAQSIAGSIVGTVTDPGDLAIVGAKVTLTQTATGAVRSAVSDERGDFVFGTLQPGEYSIKVEMAGFKSLVKTGIPLSAAERMPVGRLQLEVGAVAESHRGERPRHGGADGQRGAGRHHHSSQVDLIAIKGRNVMELLQLLPGVVNNTNSDVISRGWNLNVNGGRQNTTSVSYDGMATNAIGNNNNSVLMISQDTVAEVKVLLSNYQAEYGRMSGANVQIVTKSRHARLPRAGLVLQAARAVQRQQLLQQPGGRGQAAVPLQHLELQHRRAGLTSRASSTRTAKSCSSSGPRSSGRCKSGTALQRITVPTDRKRRGDFSQSVDLNNRLIVVRDPRDKRGRSRATSSRRTASTPAAQALLRVFPSPNFFDRNISAGRLQLHLPGGEQRAQEHHHAEDGLQSELQQPDHWQLLAPRRFAARTHSWATA